MEVPKIAKIYRIGPTRWWLYFNRDGKVVCYNCDDPIEIEDPVVSRISRCKINKTRTYLYCLKCGDDLNIITEEQAAMALQEVIISL